MLIVAAIAVSVHAQQRPVRDNAAPTLSGTAAIAGMVVAADLAGQPLANASVMIVGTENGLFKMIMTDDEGRYEATGLPAGRYVVGAAKPRYVESFYGATHAGRPGTAIELRDGQQVNDVALKLTLGGVISGVIMDERGQPAPGASISLLEYQSKTGPPTPILSRLSAQMHHADNRGEYRLFGLPPGTYAISATPAMPGGRDVHALTTGEMEAGLQALKSPATPGDATPKAPARPPASTVINQPAAAQGAFDPFAGAPPVVGELAGLLGAGATVGYAPVYYPGTTDAMSATQITLGSGEERGGIDVRIALVPTARIDGTVVNDDGSPGQNVRVSMNTMVNPLGRGPLAGMFGSLLSNLGGNTNVRPDGRFSFSGIAPGHYTITARTNATGGRGGAAAAATARWATSEVDVNGQNISDLLLTLHPGMKISGRVTFEATTVTPPNDYSQVSVVTLSAGDARSAQVQPDGTFVLSGLAPGTYLLGATFNGPEMLTWKARAIMIAGHDMLDLPITITADEDLADVAITLTDRQQEVSGVLQDATGRPASQYTIVLFPRDEKYWTPDSRRILVARPGTDGRFQFKGPLGPPPGEYFLAAVTDLDADAEHDPDFLKALVSAAVRISVALGERTVQDLKIGR